jgi:NADH-quinone oxidoreductase subunit A
MSEYLGILLLLAASAAVAGAMVSLNSILGPRRPGEVKQQPFECGKDPFALPAGRFEVHFYLTALLFILFDVELVFLYPWAVACRTLGAAGAAQMAVFLGVLMVGFWYAWDNGALEWE